MIKIRPGLITIGGLLVVGIACILWMCSLQGCQGPPPPVTPPPAAAPRTETPKTGPTFDAADKGLAGAGGWADAVIQLIKDIMAAAPENATVQAKGAQAGQDAGKLKAELATAQGAVVTLKGQVATLDGQKTKAEASAGEWQAFAGKETKRANDAESAAKTAGEERDKAKADLNARGRNRAELSLNGIGLVFLALAGWMIYQFFAGGGVIQAAQAIAQPKSIFRRFGAIGALLAMGIGCLVASAEFDNIILVFKWTGGIVACIGILAFVAHLWKHNAAAKAQRTDREEAEWAVNESMKQPIDRRWPFIISALKTDAQIALAEPLHRLAMADPKAEPPLFQS